MIWVMKSPPAKKPITATTDAICKFAIPLIACPDVQPPAYRAPNPTRNPPRTIKMSPCADNKLPQLNTSDGTKPVKSVSPRFRKSFIVDWEMAIGSGFAKTKPPKNPPTKIPMTNTIFHNPSVFQSYLKNSISPGAHAAQV